MKPSSTHVIIYLVLMVALSLCAVTVTATGEDVSEDAASESIEASSQENLNSSEQSVSSEESEGISSAETTSSKPSTKPGGSTFIDETGSNVSLPFQGGIEVEDGDEETLDTEEEMGVEEEVEHYEDGKVVAMSSLIYRYIWIPILLSVLCVVALVYVNTAFRLRFASGGKKAVRRSANRKGAKRRAVRRKVK